jgi:hypothetical protein
MIENESARFLPEAVLKKHCNYLLLELRSLPLPSAISTVGRGSHLHPFIRRAHSERAKQKHQ